MTARVFAEVASRLSTPPVIGEILAGVLLGPSLFGWIEPVESLRLLAEIGIILLLFEVGLDTDIKRLIRSGRKAVIVALPGFFLPLPALEQDRDYSELPASLARSLAIFQLGESGGGTIVKQALHNRLQGIDEYYAAAMALFVEEEHRHANILAMCVRLLNGTVIRSNWTARLFVFGRRLIGLRLKVIVLLAAEVVGICYYHLLAVHLPPSRLRNQLLDIVEDERAHLYFHCEFLRTQTPQRWQKRLFVCVSRVVMASAVVVVAIDHRRAIRDLDIGFAAVVSRWQSYSLLAETLVVADRKTQEPIQTECCE